MIRLGHRRSCAPQNFYMNGEIVRLSRPESTSDVAACAVVAEVKKPQTAKRLQSRGWFLLAPDSPVSASATSSEPTSAPDDNASPGASEGRDMDAFNLSPLRQSVPEFKTWLKTWALTADDADYLHALLAAENRKKRPRKGVKSAIKKRLQALVS